MASERRGLYNESEPQEPGPETPERKLLMAILTRALLDLGPTVTGEVRRCSLIWFRGLQDSQAPFPYRFIVETLNLRAKLINWIEMAVTQAEAFEEIARVIKNKNLEPKLSRRMIRQAWQDQCDATGEDSLQRRWVFSRVQYRKSK